MRNFQITLANKLHMRWNKKYVEVHDCLLYNINPKSNILIVNNVMTLNWISFYFLYRIHSNLKLSLTNFVLFEISSGLYF